MARYLADTSAWSVARRRHAAPALREEFAQLVVDDEIATCGIVKWELLHSANNHEEFAARRDQLDALAQCPLDEAQIERAIDVAQELALKGSARHRSVKLQDALIAAAAERAGVTVLHSDGDFDTIAAVTGQPTRWIRRRGSL